MATNQVPVGIVGGGKGGLELLRVLHKSSMVQVLFVCDRNDSAPAMEYAKSHQIPTIHDINEANSDQVEFVLEVTGSEKVLDLLTQHFDRRKIIDNRAAFFLFEVLADYSRVMNAHVEHDIGEVKSQISGSIAKTNSLLEQITVISNELRMVGINMSIEASRLGAQAAGFTVIAGKVQESVAAVKNMAAEIDKVNRGMLTTLEDIEAARKKLTESSDN